MKKLLVLLVVLCLCLGVGTALAADPDHDTHVWGELIVDTEPTCQAKGVGHYECTIDGCDAKSDPVEIDKVDHVAGDLDDEDYPKDPTCTEKGHTKLVHCKNCGELIEGEYIDALGHDFSVVVPATDPTCTEAGYSEYVKCSRCTAIDPDHPKTKTADPLGHVPVPAEDYTAPDCTANEPVSVKAKCDRCGEELLDKIVIPVPDHKFEINVPAKAATCTEKGYEAYKQCSVCGKTDPDPIKEIPALGHDFSVYKNALAGDCTHDGRLAGLYCSRCGAPENDGMILPAPGHKEEIIPAVPATCTKTGLTEGKKCSVCDEILQEQQVVPALNHTNPDGTSAWTTVLGTKATCTEEGIGAHRVCGLCGAIEWADPTKKVIPAHGHSNEAGYYPETEEYQAAGLAGKERPALAPYITPEEAAKAKDATCTKAGYKPAESCKFCKKVLVPGEVIPALGHDWKLIVPGTLPTCVDAGVSDLWKCDRCGLEMGGEPINPRGHALQEVKGFLPGCTYRGLFPYRKCTNEGCNYAEADANLQMIDARLPEDLQVVATLPDNPSGKIVTVMPADGSHPDAYRVPAYKHRYTEPVRPVEPTCTENGIADGATRCLICGEYFNLQALRALGHDIVRVNGYDPTCVDEGLKNYAYCARCGKAAEVSKTATDEQIEALLTASSIVKPEGKDPAEMIIDALGHVPTAGEPKDPTCTEPGRTAGIFCDRCGMTLEEQDEIPALGHDMQLFKAKVEPTCTKVGYEEIKKCSRCGLEEGGAEIPALGHDAGKPTAPKDPTCTEYGFTEGAHCTRCAVDYAPVKDYLLGIGVITGADLYEAGWLKVPELIDPLGHDMSAPKNAAATCEEEGYENYCECQREGCDYFTGKILPALGHDWISVPGGEKTAPTCIKAGTDGLQQCERCLKTEVKVIPALGHDIVHHDAVAPTCVDAGNVAYDECTRCGWIWLEGDEKTEANVKTLDDVTLPATGIHTWEHLDAVAPTCTKSGYTEGQECSVCHTIVRTEIDPDPEAWHDYLSALIIDADGKLIEDKVAELVAAGLINDNKPEDATTPGSGMRTITCAECGYPLYVELYPYVLKGDVNMDGFVNPQDALMVLQYYAGVISTVPNVVAADFDGDGNVTPVDALGILRYYAAQ